MKLLDVLAFLVPFLRFIEVEYVGRVYASEAVLVVLLVLLLLERGAALLKPMPRTFLLLSFVWLLSQVVTDVLQDTPFHDYARGWANIGMMMLAFCALYLLINGSWLRIRLYFLGLAAGGGIAYFVNPSIYAEDLPWKFGYGPPITFVLLSMVVLLGERPRLQLLCMYGLAILNIYMGSRGLGAVLFLAGSYLGLQVIVRKKGPGYRVPRKNILLLSVAMAISAWGVLEAYYYAAGTGILGDEALAKFERQSGGRFGVLLGGRSEILISARAIADSPIIGHGSWAKDCKYVYMYRDLIKDLGYKKYISAETCLIPSHSFLFGSWVYSGLAGVLLWLWLIFLVIKTLVVLVRAPVAVMPLIAFIAISLLWNILFSPFGADQRFIMPFYVIVLMTASAQIEVYMRHRQSSRRLPENGERSRGKAGQPDLSTPLQGRR